MTTKLNTTTNTPIVARRTRKLTKTKHFRPRITFWEGLITIVKFLDNAICHGISGIGIWLICKELGIVTAAFHYFTNFGVK